MGGVAGHLSHLYDNRNLTFNEMADILQKAAKGELVGTEKTDGYNIFLGYVDGKPRAARNKGDMSRGGMTFEDLINREFRGGESARKAYVTAFNAYVKAVESLSDSEKAKIFGPNGEIFYNTEIQGPIAPNVVNYDENVVNIHRMGHKKYNKEDNSLEVVANEKESNFLDSVIDKFEEATADQDFSVRRTAFLTLNKITDEGFIEDTLNKIRKTGYSGDMSIQDYLQDKLTPYTTKSFPELDNERVESLVRRMLGDKSAPTTSQITRGMSKEVKDKVSAFNKNSKFLIAKLVQPIEMAIHDFAVELLRGLKSAYVLDNEAEVERLKKETEQAIRAIQTYDGPEKEAAQDILVRQLNKIKHHDNIDTVVEGFVFQHNGQMYKFTGNFAPMNQLLGLFKYGRGKIPQMVKELLREQNKGETVAILPGKFKPAHRGHLDMIKHYSKIADRVVVLVSPKERDGVTAKTAEVILNLYLDDANLTNVDVEIPEAPSPVGAAMNYGKRPEMKGTKIILGASTKDGDAAERFAGNVQKYAEEAEVLNPLDYAFKPVGEVLHASKFRQAIADGSDIDKYLPDTSKDRVDYIVDMVKKELTLKPKTTQKEANDPFLGIFRGLVEEVLLEEGFYDDIRKKYFKKTPKAVEKAIKVLKSGKYKAGPMGDKEIIPGGEVAKQMLANPVSLIPNLGGLIHHYHESDPDYDVRHELEHMTNRIIGHPDTAHLQNAQYIDTPTGRKQPGVVKYMEMRDTFINNRIKAMFDKEIKKTKPKTFQQLYSMIKFPQVPVASFMKSFRKRHPGYAEDFPEYTQRQSEGLVKANGKQLQNREALLNKLNKDLGVPIPLEYIKTGDEENLTKDAIEKFVGSVAVSSTGGQGAVSLTEEEIEEISSMAGGSVEGYALPLGAKPRKRKKVSEKEVNEALNYLLQKLGE